MRLTSINRRGYMFFFFFRTIRFYGHFSERCWRCTIFLLLRETSINAPDGYYWCGDRVFRTHGHETHNTRASFRLIYDTTVVIHSPVARQTMRERVDWNSKRSNSKRHRGPKCRSSTSRSHYITNSTNAASPPVLIAILSYKRPQVIGRYSPKEN